jgi:anti-sigma regulatory factor (Ser/Thr protein kinase)
VNKRPGSSGSFGRSLPADVNAPGAARRLLDRLSGHVDEDVLQRCRLVVTETVTNSVKHAGLGPSEPVQLQVTVRPRCLRAEVRDDGRGFDPAALKPPLAATSGAWGLWLVDRLTDRWGVDFSHSTRVWAEFDVPGGENGRR